MTRILSLDGGGIRGVITAQILSDLQDQLKKPLHEYFDIITGSSTGAILALAVASGIFSAQELPNLYLKNGSKIFNRKWWRKGIFRPKYDGKGLTKVLQDKFGNLRMDDAKTEVIVPTYSVSATQAIMFKSSDRNHGPIPMWEVAAASSSAPTFFPARKVDIGCMKHSLIDGGFVMNHPALCGAAEAISQGARAHSINILSIGTGEQVERMSHRAAANWGLAKWARPLIPVLFDGDSDAIDYIAKHSFQSYTRLQVRNLPNSIKKMDKHENADALRFYAYQFQDQIPKVAAMVRGW